MPVLSRALVDTGAWVSALRYDVWKSYEQAKLLQRIPFEDGRLERTAQIAGSTTGYGLGRLRVSVLDMLGPNPPGRNDPQFWELAAVPVLVQLFTNQAVTADHLESPFILGLHGGVLDGRRLVREPVAPTPTGIDSDAGPTYGQDWFLETA